jgi:hypothetical protein
VSLPLEEQRTLRMLLVHCHSPRPSFSFYPPRSEDESETEVDDFDWAGNAAFDPAEKFFPGAWSGSGILDTVASASYLVSLLESY